MKKLVTCLVILALLALPITLLSACETMDIKYTLINDGTEYEISYTASNGGKKDIKIPAKYEGKPVTRIADSACLNFKSMETLYIPNSIKNIGDKAFSGCINLTTITFERNSELTSIGKEAFYNCSLNSIVFPKNLSSIGSLAFSECTSIASIVIPSSVTEIREKAFYNFKSLTIYAEDENLKEGWDSKWNPIDSSGHCTVVWGCTLSEDKTYVVSFVKSVTTIETINYFFKNPTRAGYTFVCWETANLDGMEYENILVAPIGKLLAKYISN